MSHKKWREEIGGDGEFFSPPPPDEMWKKISLITQQKFVWRNANRSLNFSLINVSNKRLQRTNMKFANCKKLSQKSSGRCRKTIHLHRNLGTELK
jgi:hypothetical protein